MIASIKSGKIRKIYAFEKIEPNRIKYIFYIVSSFVLTGFMMLIFLAYLYADLLWPSIWENIPILLSLHPTFYSLALGMAVLNTTVIIIHLKSMGYEEFEYRLRDFMWGSNLRTVLLPFRLLFLLFLTFTSTLLTTLASIAILAIILYYLTKLLNFSLADTSIYGLAFVMALVFAILLYFYKSSHKKKIQNEIARNAVSSLRFSSIVTTSIPGYIGFNNGDIYVEEHELILKGRSNKIERIIEYESFLLVKDEMDDVFLWSNNKGNWSYVGHLQWVDDETIEFSRKNNPRRRIERLRKFGDVLGFETYNDVYFTDCIGTQMKLKKYENLFSPYDFGIINSSYYILKRDRKKQLYYLDIDGENKSDIYFDEFNDIQATISVYPGNRLWVILGKTLYEFDQPFTKDYVTYTLPWADRHILYSFIETGGEFAVHYTFGNSLVNAGTFVYIDPKSTTHFQLNKYIQNIYYFENKYLSVSYSNVFYKIHINQIDLKPID